MRKLFFLLLVFLILTPSVLAYPYGSGVYGERAYGFEDIITFGVIAFVNQQFIYATIYYDVLPLIMMISLGLIIAFKV